ncbi:MAG TPA: PIG-L family deacetylase [Acidimicrobiales bacterium]|nr:PIG-L family deacetylase [Acidimicrobiales bacterium]
MKRQRTLLGVWAHPDDEAYLSATATLGERGTSEPNAWPPHRLAALRRRELASSLAALDVHESHLLGYEDGDCERHDGTDAIAGLIMDIEPDLIVTFGPDGLTGHADHRAVGRWTTDAWASTQHAADLWYATLTADFHERWGGLNDQIGLWMDHADPP